MFKNLFRIAVQQAFPLQKRGRPALLSFDEAYDDILRVVRAGMQRRYLRPTAAVEDSSVLPTNASSDCIDGVRGLATAASIPLL